jgi:diamine N-acetyltransferase
MATTDSDMPGPQATVTLRPITSDTVRAICALEVAPSQRGFVAPNAVSIAQAYFEREVAWFRAIYADDAPVGFVMLEDDPVKQEYSLWRFMIDARYQGYGFGRRALQLLIDHVRTRPGATALLTSCVPGDGSPCPFYEKMGFVPTGEVDDGELVMRLDL